MDTRLKPRSQQLDDRPALLAAGFLTLALACFPRLRVSTDGPKQAPSAPVPALTPTGSLPAEASSPTCPSSAPSLCDEPRLLHELRFTTRVAHTARSHDS